MHISQLWVGLAANPVRQFWSVPIENLIMHYDVMHYEIMNCIISDGSILSKLLWSCQHYRLVLVWALWWQFNWIESATLATETSYVSTFWRDLGKTYVSGMRWRWDLMYTFQGPSLGPWVVFLNFNWASLIDPWLWDWSAKSLSTSWVTSSVPTSRLWRAEKITNY